MFQPFSSNTAGGVRTRVRTGCCSVAKKDEKRKTKENTEKWKNDADAWFLGVVARTHGWLRYAPVWDVALTPTSIGMDKMWSTTESARKMWRRPNCVAGFRIDQGPAVEISKDRRAVSSSAAQKALMQSLTILQILPSLLKRFTRKNVVCNTGIRNIKSGVSLASLIKMRSTTVTGLANKHEVYNWIRQWTFGLKVTLR